MYKKGDIFKLSEQGIKELEGMWWTSDMGLGELRFTFGEWEGFDSQIYRMPHLYEFVEPEVFEERDYEYI